MEINKKIRSKKLNSKVDLTAMVSVSFLLIVFFMVNRELAKSKLMPLVLPENRITCGPISCYSENRSLTILLGDNNKIISYQGLLNYPIAPPKQFEYGQNSIRKELFSKNKQALEYSASIGRSNSGITVIIKPSKHCNFKNLVDILDEMKIANIQSYTIVNDFIPEEKSLLAIN